MREDFCGQAIQQTTNDLIGEQEALRRQRPATLLKNSVARLPALRQKWRKGRKIETEAFPELHRIQSVNRPQSQHDPFGGPVLRVDFVSFRQGRSMLGHTLKVTGQISFISIADSA